MGLCQDLRCFIFIFSFILDAQDHDICLWVYMYLYKTSGIILCVNAFNLQKSSSVFHFFHLILCFRSPCLLIYVAQHLLPKSHLFQLPFQWAVCSCPLAGTFFSHEETWAQACLL